MWLQSGAASLESQLYSGGDVYISDKFISGRTAEL